MIDFLDSLETVLSSVYYRDLCLTGDVFVLSILSGIHCNLLTPIVLHSSV